MSVFHNVYLTKYEETKQQEAADRYSVSNRVLITYTDAVMSSFKWKNVENVPFFMPEHFLLYSARIGVFLYENKPVIYPIYPAGALMDDGEYSAYTAIFPNGKNVRLNREDVVIIFGNSLKLPTFSLISDFANKSSFALCAVDTALKRAIIPPVLSAATEEQLKKITECESPEKLLETVTVVLQEGGYGEKEIQKITLFDNRETDVLALWDVFSRYDRLFYRTFGISTVGIQKKERLTEAESTGEDEMARYTIFQDMYNCRKFGIDEANKRFGTNFEIEIMRDENTVYESKLTNEEKIEAKEIANTRGANIKTEEGVKSVTENESIEQ